MKNISKEFLISISCLSISFLIFQFSIIPSIVSRERALAQVSTTELQKDVPYRISPSKNFPGVFNFDYHFDKRAASKEANFDAPIVPFDEEKVRAFLGVGADLGSIRDAWGYPVRENAYMKKSSSDKKKTSLNILKTKEALAYDQDQTNPSIYNCRATSSVTGYFKAYFEDVELNTGVGYDDENFGAGRRAEACEVLQDISEMIMLDQTTVTPDVLFMANPNMPPGALAAATAYFGYYSAGPDNGSLHKHIISRIDPTPEEGNFDALIMTEFAGIQWDVDSSLNSSTYDLYTVLYHEVLHALGFRGLLPSTIVTTNDIHRHGTFDGFSFKDLTLADRFINLLDWTLQVPVGAPSPWFITNNVVYQGVKNIVGATPDGIRPVYSPTSWQQGSSLSHFDMSRAPGQTYVMHPSIGANTERDINNQEKEVLCHLGYQVVGIGGCSTPTPSSQDDMYAFTDLNEVCIKPLLNDQGFSGGFLTLNAVTLLSAEPGDTFTYYASADCLGSPTSNIVGARTIKFVPSSSVSSRVLLYSNRESSVGRISFPAMIKIDPLCNVSDLSEYVCNGGFETGPYTPVSTPLICLTFDDAVVPYMCQHRGTPDRINLSLFTNPTLSAINAPGHGQYIGQNVWVENSNAEAFATKLKAPLTPGQQYRLSFDYFPRQAQEASVLFGLNLSDAVNDFNNYTQPVPLPDEIIFDQSMNNPQMEWHHFEQDFVAGQAYQSLIFWGHHTGSSQSSSHFHFFDNISLIPIAEGVSATGSISGEVYQDLNADGSQQSLTEPGLSGIQVGLFQGNSSTPVQTTSTQNIPNLGKYEFNNISEGVYKIALMGESLYSLVTEPASNTLLPGYSHARQVTVSGGQLSAHNDFGISLTPPVFGCTDPNAINYNPLATVDDGSCERFIPPYVDIKVTKSLIDSTLSTFDRFITWRILIQNVGNSPATNVDIKEIIPPGLIYHGHATPSPNSYNSGLHMLSIPQILPGAQTYIDITTKVPVSSKVCGPKTNMAVLHALTELDVNSNNNEGLATIQLQKCKQTTSPQLETG